MRERFTKSLVRSRRSKVMISHGKKPYDQPDDHAESNLSKFIGCPTNTVANGFNVVGSDIVELYCKNDNTNHIELEGRQTRAQFSDSTKFEEDVIDMCSMCKDCAECQLQDNTVKTRKIIKNLTNDQNKEHLDSYEREVNETAPISSAVEHNAPILVDLTREEPKITWKQTILKRFGNAKNLETSGEDAIMNESDVSSHLRVMIADSSSRLQRSGTGGSLATALKARGPCVIPVQPNRSLPIRPAPPPPTRSAASIVTSRKMRSPILKLSKPVNFDVVEVQSEKSPSGVLTNELNKFPFVQHDKKDDGVMLANEFIERSDFILPDMTNVVQITQKVNSVKRENGEEMNKEHEKEITIDMKKHRKSHEVDNSVERVKNILKEYSRMCSGSLASKEERKSQNVVLGLWDDERCSSSVVVSTTETEVENTKEICNKVVPPLRLKKVVREVSTTDEYRNVEVNNESGNELNYRIVTGATPRPNSPSWYSASFWSSVRSEKDLDKSTLRDKNRRSSPKSNGYKIKYRRNRLRQKLRELRGKALKLSREMATCSNNADTSPQRSTRLRQMMNCYEKQIENVSKLLCKLSASIPPTSSDVVVDLDCENELDKERTVANTDNIEQTLNKAPTNVSPSLSPGPPKLSTPSPIDYEKGKSPDKVRDSPPVLPRIYIAIQPMTLECLKQNINAAKNWRTSGDSSSSSSLDKGTKVLNDTDRTIVRSSMINKSVMSPVSLSEFKNAGSGSTECNIDRPSSRLSLVMKNSEIEEKILESAKTFNNVEEHLRATPPISADTFLGSTVNIEVDDARMTKELAPVQKCLDEVATQVSQEALVADNQATREKQEGKQEQNRSNKTLSSSSPSTFETTGKIRDYTTYDSGERISDEDRTVASTVNATQEASTMIGRSQVSTSNVDILQTQSNYYSSSVVPHKTAFTSVTQNSKNAQKVTTSVSQSVTLNPTMSLVYTQSGSTVSSSNQQCVVLPNSCNNEAAQKSTDQRNDGNRIMMEQFPTLGNWVARMSKKQSSKSKTKLQSGVTLPTASTAEVARVPGLDTQKVRVGVPSIATRSNIVNVAPQWNTERCQRQQHQQQLYAPAVRPGICPPISVTQFYPSNYAIDPYGGGAAFGYHSAMYPYGDYSYHSRLHATAPPAIGGYQIPLQDPHASSLRQIHLDRRFPAHLQDATTRHFSTDLLKYPAALSATGNYQHATTGLDFDRLRTATVATQNGTTAPAACLPSLLLPPPSSLPATAQQSRTAPLPGYPASNGQCSGRNRMIPDVVAAAAAAAVVAAASFDRQRGPLPPPYARTDAEMVSGAIGGMIDNESTQLLANRATSRERLSEQVQSVTGGVGADSRLNSSGYRHLQNLSMDRVPYARANGSYSQPTIFGDNTQEVAAPSVSSSTYESNVTPTSSTMASRETVRRESRNCDTPHLGKVNRTPDTTSNLECSNCGRTGSMFKCLGCEAAFYCDERCQARHWNIHVEECPKRMPKLKKLL